MGGPDSGLPEEERSLIENVLLFSVNSVYSVVKEAARRLTTEYTETTERRRAAEQQSSGSGMEKETG
jgi:hypothetical protein